MATNDLEYGRGGLYWLGLKSFEGRVNPQMGVCSTPERRCNGIVWDTSTLCLNMEDLP